MDSLSPLRALTWLHISDIHFGHGPERYRADQRIICTEILRDAENMVKQIGSPDLLFITGDIAFKAKTDNEYIQASDWIRKLLNTVNATKDQLYMVPGNHDVDRSKALQSATDRSVYRDLRENPGKLDEFLASPQDMARLWAKFQPYAEFASSYAAPKLSEEKPFWVVPSYASHLGPITLSGLNTNLLSFDDTDSPSTLALGNRQLHQAIHEPAPKDLIIILQHHPPDWLTDGRRLEAMLQGRPHILFCGHIHKQGGLISLPLHGGELLRLVAGAGHTDPNYPFEHAYAWGKLDSQGLAYFPRTWVEELHCFRADSTRFREMNSHGAVILERQRLPVALRNWLSNSEAHAKNRSSNVGVLISGQANMVITSEIAISPISELDPPPVKVSEIISTTRVMIRFALEPFDKQYLPMVQLALSHVLRIPPDTIQIVGLQEGSVAIIVDLPTRSAEELLRDEGGIVQKFAALIGPLHLIDIQRAPVEASRHRIGGGGIFYRSAAVGSYWHANDARIGGFIASAPAITPTVNIMIQHLSGFIANSPFISLTASFGVARSYALVGSGGTATPDNPGYVYIIDIPEHFPSSMQFFDPLQVIASSAPPPPFSMPYYHEGAPDFLLGVVNPVQFSHSLTSVRLTAAGTSTAPATPSPHLQALLWALRDAEVLVAGIIPAQYVVQRVDVY
jgi:predicted MPP superfamily phosphohydrolase